MSAQSDDLARQGRLVKYITVRQYKELRREYADLRRRIVALEVQMDEEDSEQGQTRHLHVVPSGTAS